MKTDSVNHYKLLTITAISGSYNLTFFELLQLSKLEEKMIKKIIETKVANGTTNSRIQWTTFMFTAFPSLRTHQSSNKTNSRTRF